MTMETVVAPFSVADTDLISINIIASVRYSIVNAYNIKHDLLEKSLLFIRTIHFEQEYHYFFLYKFECY